MPLGTTFCGFAWDDKAGGPSSGDNLIAQYNCCFSAKQKR